MCHFVDVDGTIFYFGTLRPLPGAMAALRSWKRRGHQIVITTGRRDLADILEVLRRNGVEPDEMLGGLMNPRHLVNDGGAYCTNHVTNEGW